MDFASRLSGLDLKGFNLQDKEECLYFIESVMALPILFINFLSREPSIIEGETD